MKTVYLDNGATTKIDEEVLKEMNKCLVNEYGNASSIHHKGINAKKELDKARRIIAESINASPEEIIFTSGGTESNNFAIKGVACANRCKGEHIITSKIEHSCVLNSCKWLEKKGYKVTYLNVDEEGFVSPDELRKAITNETILVSIIHGNNEIGTIQNLKELYAICKEKGILFHTDACQSHCKTEINSDMADMITLNAHKIHGPKGVGALYIKNGTKISPQMHGGGQENKMRSGTENISSIAGFAKAVEIAQKQDNKKIMDLRDYFIKKILEIKGTKLNGSEGDKRLCNNINVSFFGIEGESIVSSLDLKGICTSTGSACSSKSLEPSHVLMALENDPERAHGSVRFTTSRFTTKEDIDYTIKELKEIVEKLRSISPICTKEE